MDSKCCKYLLTFLLLISSFRGIVCIDFNQNDLVGHELTLHNCSTISNPEYSITSISPVEAIDYFDIDSGGQIVLLVPGLSIPVGSYSVTARCIGDSQYINNYNFERKEKNEYPPIFDHSTQLSIIISESSKGTVVLDVNATDQDLGDYGKITYQLSGNHVNLIFSLNSSTGELTLTGTNFLYSVYNLTITAMTENDINSEVAHSSESNVTANVNFSPEFSQSVYSTSVSENEMPSLGFISVNCTDKETPSDELLYSLEDISTDSFNINSDGQLQSLVTFDYDKGVQFYEFTAVCSDGTESAEATIQISVSPVNEHAPTIEVTKNSNLPLIVFQEDQVQEDDIVASMDDEDAYFKITADDEDAGNDGDLTFSVSGFNTDVKDFFAINSTNGEVYYTKKLDIDSTKKAGVAIAFVIKACDPGNLCTTSDSSSFVVINSADELPMFEQDSYHTTKVENEVILLLTTVKCSDGDHGSGAIKQVELYNQTFSNKSQVTLSFNNEIKTEITVEIFLNSALDYEDNSFYALYFRCTDSVGNSAFSNVTIEVTPVNDLSPVFTKKIYTFNVSRTTPGDEDYIVGTVRAVDGDLVVGNQVSYSIITSTDIFDVNNNGDIILKKSLESYIYDFISVQVEATDDDNKHKDSTTVFVDIETGNYLSPEFTGETQVEDISELTAIGTKVLSVFCNDTEPDENGRVSYEIYGGNSGDAFRIDSETGEIFVNNLLILPQGEQSVTYALTLKCSDNGIPSLSDFGSAIVQVYKADILHPDIKNETIITFIDEGVALSYLLVTITAEDLDTENLMYFFQNESHPGAFLITVASGEVRVNSEIDREKVSEYSMIVVAEEVPDEFNQDPKNDSADMYIYVRDINDNSPDCGIVSTSVEISNRLKLDRTIYQLNCEDDDVGNNGNITYDLENGFGVIGIEVNGRIFLESPLNNSNASTFYLEITVSDQGSLVQNQLELTILVIVLSTNDNPPMFVNLPGSIDVDEDSGTFNSIFTVEAEDEDRGIHSVVRYRLLDESNFPFRLIPNTGELYITQSLDYHSQSSYTLNISAADTDYVVYSTLTINIVDVNEYTPECSSTLFTQSIVEGSAPSDNQPIDFGCSDADKGINGEIVYEIISGNSNAEFGISDGSLELLKALDYETQEDYDIEVRISDSGNPPQSTSVTVRINVLPVNEFSPDLVQDSYSESITEGADIGSTILTVVASDGDSGVHGDLQFSLDPQQTDFGITNDGDLIITGDIDREATASYNFEVIVQDSGTSPKSSSATIDITVLDLDDNSPSFTQDLYTSSVDSDDAVLNSLVASVNCTDPDHEENADVNYSIINSEDSTFFNISSKGDVTISKSLLVSGIYSFGVKCSGVANPNLTDTAQVSITIAVDSNITFSEDVYNINLFENATIGTVIVTINASSITKSALTYNLIDSALTLFQLDKGSGDLTLAGELDYEITQSYVLEVEATDSGSPPNSGSVAVNIIVKNINDNSPSFVESSLSIEVTEEEADFISLATYKCDDSDLGSFGEISYSLSGDNTDYFKLDKTSGKLLLNNPIDYEEVTSPIELQVTCSDGGTPAETDSLSVLVSVIAVNEYVPEFSSDSVSISLSESVVPPSILNLGDSLIASDNDDSPHNSIYYSIVSGNDDNTFFLSSDEGTLTLITKLDYETQPSYELTIAADDSGGEADPDYPVKNSTIDVLITITDANDNDPAFNKNVYVGSLSEISEIDDHVEMVTLICTDSDSGDNGKTTISIINGNEDGIFEIDNSNGKVILKKKVDFESNTFYSLTIRCSDMGSPSRHEDASLTINIEDYSEYGPLFEEQIYEFSVNETTAAGSIVGQVKAVDADAGSNSEIIYSADTEGPFAIDSDSGVITISSPLDYETPPTSFVFNVTALDQNNEKDVTIVAINILNVDDNKPKFEAASYYGEINENSNPGQVVFFDSAFSCSDADDKADGIAPTFSLISTNSIPFSIDTEGDTSIVSNDKLDLEATNRYTFTIYCFDSGLSNTSSIVTIDILPFNDFAPEFQNTPYATTLSEDTSISTSVFEVEATDKDQIDYNEITFGIFSGNDRGDFEIDSISGVVRIAKDLDYEEVTSYTLKISASNIVPPDDISPSLVSYTDLNIEVTDINDNHPLLTSTSTYVIANESEPAGYHIADVTCEDPDSGEFGNITITLTNFMNFFQLMDNGTIVSTGSYIPEVNLQIDCSDMGDPPLTSTLVITVAYENVNLHHPDFGVTSIYFTIYENHTIGDEIGCANATDADTAETPSGVLTYSMVLVTGENHFLVNKATGCLSVSTTLDFDDINSYVYTIRATDGGVPAKYDEALVYIEILNVVFDPPQFTESSLTRTISENVPAGALVTKTLLCTDRDDDDVITYSISSGNEDGVFNVNSSTGEVVLAEPLDYEMQTHYVLTLRCNDSSNLYDEAVISITVESVNEYTPVIIEMVVYADEESPVGTEITIISYTDLDDGPDGEVDFEIIGGGYEDSFFVINDVLYFNETLDREDNVPVYPVQLRITDRAPLSRSSINFVNVSLNDINDNAPIPGQSVYTTQEVNATIDLGSSIENVSCTDKDLGMNAEVIYSIEKNSLLTVNSESGEVTVSGDLRNRKTDTIALSLTCTDKGLPSLSAEFLIQVPVLDPNLFDPVFLESSYSSTLPENYNLSTVFLNVTATDNDFGLNGDIEYSLANDFDNLFYIDSVNGEISLLTELDFETDDFYSLEVLAIDGASDSPMRRTGSATVSINVTGINEFTPECKKPIYTAIISANDTGPILQLGCEDADNGVDGEIDFDITPGSSHSGLFTVNSTGWISIPSSIPPNASIEVYEISVTVFDKGSPSKEYQVEVDLIYSFKNEHTPVFSADSYSSSTSESTSVGIVVVSVSASDEDPGLQGDIQYSVSGTNYFRVNPQNGDIYISEELDYEQEMSVSFIVIATDSDPSEPLSSNASVTITIEDVNDNSPSCDEAFYSAEIGSSLAINETVFNITGLCADIDGAANSQLSYSLTPTNTFNVNADTGIIYVSGDLTAGTSTALTVTVKDSGSPSLSTDITVSVIVRFDNVEPPHFTNSTYEFNIAEDADLLSVIGQVSASDADTDANDLTYTLTTNEYSDIFYVDPQSGEILLTDQLDHEYVTSYEVTVRVEDSGNYDGTNKLSDNSTVIITVDNVNDNTPVLNDDGLYGVIVNKTTPVNEVVVTITCTDADSPPYASPSITQHGFTSEIPFKLVEAGDEWEIQVSSVLTTINGSVSYDVNFTCSDNGGEEVIGQVFLSVPDVDAPVFNQSSYEWHLSEDVESGESFTYIKATSKDQSDVEYELIDGNSNNLFYIHPITGAVSLTGSLDYEKQTSYGLVIQATDGKQRSSTVLLRVFVLDVDDHIPLVPPSGYLTVNHNKPLGYPVGSVNCVDDDYNGGNFSFNFVETSDEFAIDDDGIITLISVLDETPVYVLPVSCYDKSDPDSVSTGIVTIQIVFLNLYEPEFDLSNYVVSVKESVEIDSLVVNVSATDDDIGNQGKLSYSIASGSEDKFYINTQTGVISVLTSLDRESEDSYVLTVNAVDGGVSNITVRKTGSTTVNVNVEDVNDNNPVFMEQVYVATILTNHTVLSEVVQVQCQDDDSGLNGEFDYSIQPSHDTFIIDTSGVITLAEAQSEETVYNIYAYCTDKGDPSLSSSALVTVAINQVELGDPIFNDTLYSVTIPEDQELLDTFLTVTATVDNPDVDIAYSIISGNDASTFTINANTGELSLIENLDYNTLSTYTLTVKATTLTFSQKSSQVLITITVTDVNNNEPVFSPLPFYSGRVKESDDINTPVVQVNCTDDDPTDVLSYTLSGNNPSNGGDYFRITDTGLVTVKQSLDYESTTVYTLSVECSDGTNEVEATVRVDIDPVNEFTPVFLSSLYSFTVDENADIGDEVGYVNATDDDTGIDGEITYLIDDPEDLSPIFIDPTSGRIVISLLLDYEVQDFYNVSVIARDSGGSESYVPVELNVTNLNDEPPVLTPSITTYSGRVTTDSPEDLFIKSFVCSDPDGGSTSISITSGNEKGYFKLNSINQLVWNGTSDSLESDIVVTIMLKCTDEANEEDTSSIAIVVGKPGVDPPEFTSSKFTDSIQENATIDTSVLSVKATPSLSNHTIEYSLFSFDVGVPFAIDNISGIITVNDLLDYESFDFYTFPVQAKDVEDGSIALATVEITILDINDNSPEILPSTITVYVKEDASTDIAYAKFSCSDSDNNENGDTVFMIEGSEADTFAISSTSGSVTLKESLDFESVVMHNVTVVCVDNGVPQLTGSATLIVQVTGVNEHAPKFDKASYTFTTQENSTLGKSVGFVNASDEDDGINGVFYYDVSGGNGQDYFRIDESDGEIYVNDYLNASMSDSLSLVISATDNGPPSAMVTTVLVDLSITDVNEKPYFDKLSYTKLIATDVAMEGDVLGTVNCFDYDMGSNAELTMTISTNDLPEVLIFEGDSMGNGSLSRDLVLNSTIDAGDYEVRIQCKDSGSPSLSMSVSFAVTVEGVNTAPEFSMSVYGLSVHEDIEIDKSLLTVVATDLEADSVSYALIGGAGLGSFHVDETTGVLSLSQSLDFETTETYTLTVGAIDDDELNPMTGSATIAITVKNVNDHAPVVSPASFTSTLTEDTYETAKELYQFTCTDIDGGSTVFSVTPNPPFSISSDGMVSFIGTADYEETVQYTVTVTCTDEAIAGGDVVMKETATLIVTIDPVNFFAPILTSESIFNVSEGSDVGDEIFVLTATDPDGRGTITFTSSSHDETFLLDNDGTMNLLNELDRETDDMYELTVQISDGDTEDTPKTTIVQIIINIVDVNDNSPVCSSTLDTIYINAGTYNDSISLYNTSCSDDDIGNNSIIVYSIKADSLPDEGSYSMDSETGELTFVGTVTKLSTATVISIIVSDSGKEPTSPAEIQLILSVITGDEPHFDPDRFSVNISENQAPEVFYSGQNFKNALKNVDEDAHIQFSLSTNSSIFVVNPSTGDVVLITSGLLDYDEGLQEYSLGIQAKIGSVEIEYAEAILDISIHDYNDNPPVFSMSTYNGSILENLDESDFESTVILTVSATDIDSDINADFTYSLTGIGGINFEVDEDTGEIRAKKTFDRETTALYSFFVVATDEGDPAQSSSTAIVIEIADENDNPPVFKVNQYIITMADNTKVNTVLETIQAEDPDTTGILRYDLLSEDATLNFIDVDPLNGQLQVTAPIPDDHKLLYEFKISCNDLKATAETNVILYVVTVRVLEFNWVENTANQTENIYEFLASNYNVSENAHYTITGGNEYNNFEIIGNGIFTNKLLLDRENTSLHNIQVTVNDSSTSEAFIVTLLITVLDVNDNPPVFEYDFYQFNITEGIYFQKAVIGSVRATDNDEENTVNSFIQYQIFDNSGEGALNAEIDIFTGVVTVLGNVDREYSERYTLTIVASDSGQPTPLLDFVEVEILLSDVNDNAPRFDVIGVSQFTLYFENGGQTNSVPYKIISDASFGGQKEISEIEFSDPDSSSTPKATLQDSSYLELDSPYSPLVLFTNTNVTYRMNQSTFTIMLSDGSYDLFVPALIIVTEKIVIPSSTTTTSTKIVRFTTTTEPTLDITPTGRGVEEFVESATGIAVITVGCVLLFAILFFVLGLMCYCYQRYRQRQDQAKRRPTSVFKRVAGERPEHTEMNQYSYDNIDSLDYPHLAPNDKQNGELYGEHNVVETEFTDQMYPYPAMYPNPSYYPYQFGMPAPGSMYDDMTMSSQLHSDTYEEYEEEETEETKTNLGIRKEPGSILNQMLDEFHLGDEILKHDKKKRLSVKNLSKGTAL